MNTAQTVVEIMKTLHPAGFQPAQYDQLQAEIEIGLALHAPKQTDAQKLNMLAVTSVQQKHTWDGMPAGLSKGAQAVLSLVHAKPTNVAEIVKATGYHRTYVYTLVKKIRAMLGEKFVTTRDGRVETFSLRT